MAIVQKSEINLAIKVSEIISNADPQQLANAETNSGVRNIINEASIMIGYTTADILFVGSHDEFERKLARHR